MCKNYKFKSDLKRRKLYRNIVKRFLDIIISLLVLLFFWWIYLIIAILVFINMGRPILYVSERMGKNERPFKIYKFRTMTNEVDENGVLLPGDKRLTKFGIILRSTSMDEIPSILSIIKGDMSIVGPRPLLMKYKPYYYEYERVRHSIRPGLTGWAQVNGRNALSWDDKFKMDIEYTEKESFIFDLKIILMTVYKVIKKADIINGQQAESLHIVRKDMYTSRKMEEVNEFTSGKTSINNK